jgi:hypothetical protein
MAGAQFTCFAGTKVQILMERKKKKKEKNTRPPELFFGRLLLERSKRCSGSSAPIGRLLLERSNSCSWSAARAASHRRERDKGHTLKHNEEDIEAAD